MATREDIDSAQPAFAERGNMFDMKGLAAAFRRRWLLFAVLAAIVFIAILSVTLLLTPTWTSSAQIKIEPDPRASTDLQAAVNGQPPDQARVDTEVALMRSRDVARTVVDRFKLASDREFAKDTTSGEAAETATTALMKRTDVARLASTYLVDLQVRSKDPAKAARLANALAEEYLNASVRARVGTATDDTRFLNQQLSALGAEVRAAEARAAQYRSSVGIVEGAENGTITEQQIAPLASQLATAEAEAAAASARLAAAQGQIRSGGIASVSGVLNSTVVADLRRQLAEVLRKQGDARARYGEKHPESIALQQQVDGLNRQLREESVRTVEGIRSDASAANASANSLRNRISALRASQARESRAGVAAESYDRDAETKRTVYNQTAQRAQQTAQQRQNTAATAQIVARAEPALRPSFPNVPLFAMLGLFLGVCAGATGVMVAENLDVGLRGQDEVERWLRAPFVGAVPRLSKSQLRGVGDGNAADYIVSAPASEFAEGLRTIRQTLVDPAIKIVTVCSSLPGEGKSTVALALARVMAMSGDRVVIVDCDLRRGTLAKISGVEVEHGLVAVLTGEATLDDTLVDDPMTKLKMLPLAKRGFTPRDLFGGSEMARLLEILKGRFDRVILDTPPLLAITDARTLAARSDATIMLVRWNSTSKFAAQAAVKRLRLDNTAISGVVLTMVEKRGGLSRSDPAYYSSAYTDYYRD